MTRPGWIPTIVSIGAAPRSVPASFWTSLRLVGLSGRLSGYGRLLEEAKAPAKAA